MSGQCHWVDSGCDGSGGMMMLVSHEWEHGDTRARVTVVILILVITLMVLHVFFCVCFLFESSQRRSLFVSGAAKNRNIGCKDAEIWIYRFET